jgi:hypothetical protein
MNKLRPRTEPGPVADKDGHDLSSAGSPPVKPNLPIGYIYNPPDPNPCPLCSYPRLYRWNGEQWEPWGPLETQHWNCCPGRKVLDPTRCHLCGSTDVEVTNPRPDVHPGGYLKCNACKRGRWLRADPGGARLVEARP